MYQTPTPGDFASTDDSNEIEMKVGRPSPYMVSSKLFVSRVIYQCHFVLLSGPLSTIIEFVSSVSLP